MIPIRKAEPKDFPEIRILVKAAFASAEHADGNEAELVEALRAGEAYLPELSLVAEEHGRIIGHVLFTRATVASEAVLALAPLSVLPDRQRRGVGSALVLEGHRIAAQMGFGYSVVLGSNAYYPRFGYKPAKTFGITAPFDVPEAYFMACRLRSDAPAIRGVMTYAKEFGIG